MGHPEINNRTPFAVELTGGLDEQGREVVATVVKATLVLNAAGKLELAEEQAPPSLGGEYWGEPPEQHGFKFEPEGGHFKAATDVVLVGHASPPRSGVPSFDIAFRVGPLTKTVRVFGSRVWYRGATGPAISAPRPVERIPLCYRHAFGGWDRSHPDPAKHDVEPRNPIGVGFRAKGAKFVDHSILPNLEDPRSPVRDYDGRSTPACFGFISPEWAPRSEYVGTYDANWTKSRMPLLPADFDPRFFNAASPGLVARGYLEGSEVVSVSGVDGLGEAAFALPGFAAPTCRLRPLYGAERPLLTKLDTVIVFADERKVFLLWRAYTPIQNGIHAVRAVEIDCQNVQVVPRPSRPLPDNVIPLNRGAA